MDLSNIIYFLIAFFFSIVVIKPVFMLLYKLKVGQVILGDTPDTHAKKAGTPTMGGLIIIFGFLVGYVIWLLMDLQSAVPYLPLIGYMLISGVIGAVDDWYTVHPKNGIRGIKSTPKAIIQILASILFIYSVMTFNPGIGLWLGNFHLNGIWFGIIFVLVTAGFMNFVNLTDGLDGLLSGLTVILAGILGFALNMPILVILAGACLAFLTVNSNPAKIFMGDTASLFIGSGLMGFAIIAGYEIVVLIAGMLFLVEGFSVMIQWAYFKYTRIRFGEGKRIFKKAPIHHHFEMCGYPEQKIVVSFWIIGLIFALIAVLYANFF